MELRTNEQFLHLADNSINGNLKDSFKNAVDGGFYANDLIEAYNNNRDYLGDNFTLEDVARIAEGAQKLRSNK